MSGSNSAVEFLPSKQAVAGSNPVSRSTSLPDRPRHVIPPEDFWVNLSHSFFVAYDNVDQVVRWLPDALAQVATGVRRSKRQLHTTNTLNRFKLSCMIGVTARTPTVSLRREDVAGRTLVFNLKPLETKRAEYDIQTEISALRDELMSDYAHTIQQTLRVPLEDVEVADPGMRMADFARVATRIGRSLGDLHSQKSDEVIAKLRASQHQFATEEDTLAVLSGLWIGRNKPLAPDQMDLGVVSNNGCRVTPTELQSELNALAKELEHPRALRVGQCAQQPDQHHGSGSLRGVRHHQGSEEIWTLVGVSSQGGAGP